MSNSSQYRIRVFVQNESGSRIKNIHNERTLEWIRETEVSRSYPFPYGFVPGTLAEDDCAVDCFVITSRALASGEQVDCVVLGLLEQFEDGEVDHNLIATPVEEMRAATDADLERIRDFIQHVFSHVPGKNIRTGRYRSNDEALAHIRSHSAPNRNERIR